MTLIFHKGIYHNLDQNTGIRFTSVKVEIWFLGGGKVIITNPKQIKEIADWLQKQEIL